MAANDFTPLGSRFGMLEVIGEPYKDRFYVWKVRCRCDCGNESDPSCQQLVLSRTKSCGCKRRSALGDASRKHGRSGDKNGIYRIWNAMLQRCGNPSNAYYADYGGRGIVVCDRWLSFENFLADMGDPPSGMTLDRYPDVNGNYEPDNCRWATPREQSNNKRNNIFIEFDGKRLTAAEWSRETGIKLATILWRINAGWPPARTLQTPPR